MACKRSPVRSRYSPPLAQMRVKNTVDFKSKSTVFLYLSASKFIAVLQILRKIKLEKLLSYLSAESIRQSSLSFDIPFDRQQLADFLCVERAAMSVELSKLQKEGLLVTKRNHFELLTH